MLHTYTFADRDEGTLVVLGFGLLLCECWRVVEAEADDENIPQFIQESLLGKKRADKVIQAIKMVIGTDEEKELDGGVKGQKARAGQKKWKGDNSSVRNARSQRQCKPSKKLLGSDYI